MEFLDNFDVRHNSMFFPEQDGSNQGIGRPRGANLGCLILTLIALVWLFYLVFGH